MKIRIKTEKELKNMFMLDEHKNADEYPISFMSYVEYIPESIFGRSLSVVDVSKSLFTDDVPFITFPAYFVVLDGKSHWNISSKFIKRVEL